MGSDMCAINPKRKRFFKLEFFTTVDFTDHEWIELVMTKLVELEQKFNEKGNVRVHIHDLTE